MKIASAAYALDWHDNWHSYEDKVSAWVEGAAEAGADLMVFPEYGALELATLAGPEIAADIQDSIFAVSEVMPDAIDLMKHLATTHNVLIAAPTAPICRDDGKPVNRAYLIGPNGQVGHQDKLIMTRSERDDWRIQPGGKTVVFDTSVGKVGIITCYDSEFPLIARAMVEAGAEILLVPSCTEDLSGYWRVRIGAMARALENQCVVAHAPMVGDAPWCAEIGSMTGAAAIYGPPDLGFPETGVLDEGPIDSPGWALADVNLGDIARVRREGHVLNMNHWVEQDARLSRVHTVALADGIPLAVLASSIG
ncbi:carbon-nitrogen hydrolase family protein [Rhodobacteraceae bacterium NNCM2]|nr:carbon-nitrogen hydrolase family protein [Coraliihabitans acroporae]